MKRKMVTICLVSGIISALSLSVFAMQTSTARIERKREHINNNPYIPQEKKDLINNKFDTINDKLTTKENIIKQTVTNATSNKYITKSEAKAIAVQHAGLKEAEVTFVNGYLRYDDGRAEYRIEFWKDNTEYDYDIDAITGTILSYDYDIESYSIPSGNGKVAITTGIEKAKDQIESEREHINNNPYIPQEKKDLINSKFDAINNKLTTKENAIQQATSNNATNNYISKSKAKEIALQNAGLKESEVTFVNGYLRYDDGRAEYKIEFWKDNTEYDYEIDAITGDILGYDYDIEFYSISDVKSESSKSYITESEAKAIALEHARLKESEIRLKKVKFDYDHGWAEYEIEFYQGRTEYEYTIDAATGKILDYNMDYDD